MVTNYGKTVMTVNFLKTLTEKEVVDDYLELSFSKWIPDLL